jgi:hypothetical protein
MHYKKKSSLESQLIQSKALVEKQKIQFEIEKQLNSQAIAQSTQLTTLHSKLLQAHSSSRSLSERSTTLYNSQQTQLISSLDSRIESLNEQKNDLLFFLSTIKKIDKMDAREGGQGQGGGLKKRIQDGTAQVQLIQVGKTEEEKNNKRRGKKKG